MSRITALSTARKKRHKEKRRRVSLWSAGIFFALATFVFLLSFVSKRPEVAIHGIRISGTELISENEIRATVEKVIAGSYLFLFEKRNVVLYPRRAIEGVMRDTYPRIKNVAFSLDAGNMLLVDIEEYKPEFLWCGVIPPEEELSLEATECYFADETGYIFAPAPRFSGPVFFVLYGALSGDGDIVLRRRFVDEETMRQFTLFRDGVTKLGLLPKGLFVKEDGDAELFTERAEKVLFSTKTSSETLLANLSSVLVKIPPDTKLFSIDLRFGNKVFFKKKE